MFARYIRPAGCLMIVMTLLLGCDLPVVVTAVGSALFPFKAGGSLIYGGKTLIGSRLIGQKFSDPKYFWGRPSATSPQPYNGLASGWLQSRTAQSGLTRCGQSERETAPRRRSRQWEPIPVELVTASASGLDPDISRAAADYQAARVARARHLPLATIQSLIRQHETGPFLGIVGEPTVNVLELNLALDSLH